MKPHVLLSLLLAAPAFAAEPAAPPVESTATSAAPSVSEVAPAKSALVSLEEIGVGTGVVNRALEGKADSFPASVGLVSCFTKVKTSAAPTTITHAWYKDDAKRGEVQLQIGGSGWRTWSNHAVEPGNWRVDVLDAEGALADSVSFTVTQ